MMKFARFPHRLSARLAILLTLGLAPLGAIAIYSEWQGARVATDAQASALIAQTGDAVGGQAALLRSALLASDALGRAIIAERGDPAACSEILRDYVQGTAFFTVAGFTDLEGRMACVSEGGPLDLGTSARLRDQIENPRQTLNFDQSGLISGMPVTIATSPVYDDDTLLGFMVLSVSSVAFRRISTQPDPETAPRGTFLLNETGDVLIGELAADAIAQLPPADQLQRLVAEGEGVYTEPSRSGDTRHFTVAQLIPGQLFALGSWDANQLELASGPFIWRLAIPVVMWLASVVVVMLAVNLLVVRYLQQINRQVRRFALGDRNDIAALSQEAPTELRELNGTISKMAMIIRRNENSAAEALEEKTVLLQEVHHRVKNNLQLIASILNLQVRKVTDPMARNIIHGVQARVRSLASIHRTLYELDQITEQDSARIFNQIMNDAVSMVTTDSPDLETEADITHITVPQANLIPFSLLFTEALTNALKYVTEGPDGKRRMHVFLQENDAGARLVVWNTCYPAEDCVEGMGLGRDLMTAFAQQIDAEIEMGPTDDSRGSGWQVAVQLPLAPQKRGG
ncbi:sensor histidine kinase [Roseicitreum antarcticum]|uniref:histidine kinase n=1 Tax=Roseicitreum antarcticum TaxID=564137 RepID=A0A1H2ZC75_9RHOB|nr:histidine kinase dimerization/phosphoacceptor domain -containing protein [Roseicitreum antarcticum]SDX14945.1 Two-component sensor histidine kinase, contains HisKA and HATPase domains [Roseicitreum antarcticum]